MKTTLRFSRIFLSLRPTSNSRRVSRLRRIGAAAAVAGSLLAGEVGAAPINWLSPDLDTVASDFFTDGSLVEAINGVSDDSLVDGTVTINGITFTDTNLFANGYAVTGLVSTPDADINDLVGTVSYGGPPTVDLTGLVIGQDYALQVFIGDTRGGFGGRTITVGDGDGDTSNDVTYQYADEGVSIQATSILGGFTADATTQSFVATLGSGGSGTEFAGYQLRAIDGPLTAPSVGITVDRATGEIVLQNTGNSSSGRIIGYSFTSDAGSFDQSGWTSIADTYDADAPGPNGGTFDSDDTWVELTQAGVTTDLSEAQLEFQANPNDGGAIAAGGSFSLGNVWETTPFEDVFAQVLIDDGSDDGLIETIGVAYLNDAAVLGDLDGSGQVDTADWTLFKAGQGADFAGLTVVEGYLLGDLDGDGDHDLFDFDLFETAFDGQNGAGALASLISTVPEPSSVIVACGSVLLISVFARKRGRKSTDGLNA